jgi:hypothetical protein
MRQRLKVMAIDLKFVRMREALGYAAQIWRQESIIPNGAGELQRMVACDARARAEVYEEVQKLLDLVYSS